GFFLPFECLAVLFPCFEYSTVIVELLAEFLDALPDRAAAHHFFFDEEEFALHSVQLFAKPLYFCFGSRNRSRIFHRCTPSPDAEIAHLPAYKFFDFLDI